MIDTITISTESIGVSSSGSEEIVLATETVEITISTPTEESISISEVGAVGPPGPQGEPGDDADAFYLHDQMSASATWTITHNLNKYPSVTIVTSSGDEVEGDVNYTSINSVEITFAAAFAGKAYLN